MCLSRLDSFQDLNFRLRIQTRVLQVCSLIKLSREPTKNCKFLIFKVIFQRQKYAEYFWFFSCFKILNLENNFSLMPLFEELYSLKLYQNFVCSLENLGKRYINKSYDPFLISIKVYFSLHLEPEIQTLKVI